METRSHTEDRMLTPAETAALIGISESTLRNIVRREPMALGRIVISPRIIRFTSGAVQKWLRTRKEQAA
jgi:predicted DNA-binding transcriptional regulator AlpA